MNKTETIKSILNEIMAFFGKNHQIDVAPGKEDTVEININGDDLNYLIGYRGQSLDALADMLSHIYYAKTNEWPNFSLDINGYNQNRIERLHNLTKRFIDRVRFFQTEVEMPLLNPWERKQIHTYISDYDDVISESRGEGKNRKLYLAPRKRK